VAAGLSSLLNTAREALSAQAYGVTVAGQNITNVNTPGYARRDVLLETRALGDESYGGVQIGGLRQIQDVYLDRAELVALGHSASSNSHNQGLARVEALFNDAAGTGLGSSLDAVFNSFGDLAARPNDPTVRAQVLGNAEAFASNVRGIADDLATQSQQLLTKARAIADQINTRAKEIAGLNREIQNVEAQGRDAADLKDRRAQVLLDLGGLVDVKTTIDGSGAMLVRSSGTVLVEGGNARSLSIDLDASGAIRVLSNMGGAASDVTAFLTGGSLAGVKETRDVDIFAIARRLDEFVFDVATAINTQHAAGVGQDGIGGRDIFDVPATSAGAARGLRVSGDVAGNGAALAAAAGVPTLPGGADNAVLLAALGQTVLGASGRTPAERYGDLVGDVATRKSNASRTAEMREALHAQSTKMREAQSGVSLDEEMISLSKYQRAYEAAAKVLSTVDQMLEELIQRVGR
jgi:flagellar hook-associated protein 1 FlgK